MNMIQMRQNKVFWRKINNLRCAYIKEYKVIKESERSGSGNDDIISPR
jgi:hypothetical protein